MLKTNKVRGMRWLRIFFIATFLFFLLGSTQAPLTVKASSNLYVSTKGSDNSSCGSMAAPCRTIQYAVGKAASGDIILVSSGTYTYNASADTCSFLITRAVVCFVDKNLSIFGGYNPTNWTGPDTQKYPTVIDGQGKYRGVAVIAYNTVANLLLQGFTIQNGLAQGINSSDTFQNAAFGGGVWAQNSSVTIKNAIFKNNRAVGANLSYPAGGSGAGGGLAIQSSKSGSSTLDNVTFDGNQALGGNGSSRGGVGFGGGVYVYGSPLTGTNLTFTNNLARAGNSSGGGYDGGLTADGLGGAGGFGDGSSVSLYHVTATGNQAIGGNAGSSGTGGGGFGGGFFLEKGNFQITGAKIQFNLAQGGVAKTGGPALGGGLMTDGSNTTVSQAWVIANTAKSGGSSVNYYVGTVGGGGGYFVYWGSSGVRYASIVNSIFADNKAELGTPGANHGGGGGGASFQGVQATVTHTTFAENKLGSGLVVGQAIEVLGNGNGTSPVVANLTMRYSIISDHIGASSSSALTVLQNNIATLSYVLFANNTRNTNQDGVGMLPGSITLNHPLYRNSVGYVSPGSPNYDYHLTSSSSAIDQAIGSTTKVDIDNLSRPEGAASDIGAVEKMPTLVVDQPYKVYVPGIRK